MSDDPIELTAPDGKTIRAVLRHPFEPPMNLDDNVLMIMCHSYPNAHMAAHNNLFDRLANICAKAGIHSLRYDCRGCGQSDGDTSFTTVETVLEDLETVQAWAEENHYKRLMITAEGIGSISAIMSLQPNVIALVLLWPVFSSTEFAQKNYNAEAIKDRFEEGGNIDIDGETIGIPLIKDLYEMDFLPVLQKVVMPTLIFHGEQDEKVPISQLDLARSWFNNRRIEITTYHDGTHGLPKENHRKYMYFHYEQFLRKYV